MYLATFQSVHSALKFEKILKEKGIEVEMIPVPRKISASCGLCGKFCVSPTQIPFLSTLPYDHLYEISEDGAYLKLTEYSKTI